MADEFKGLESILGKAQLIFFVWKSSLKFPLWQSFLLKVAFQCRARFASLSWEVSITTPPLSHSRRREAIPEAYHRKEALWAPAPTTPPLSAIKFTQFPFYFSCVVSARQHSIPVSVYTDTQITCLRFLSKKTWLIINI